VTDINSTVSYWRPPSGAEACTEVVCNNGESLLVMELPQLVAVLRDRALGHEPPGPRAAP
jgi:hypothetical protein